MRQTDMMRLDWNLSQAQAELAVTQQALRDIMHGPAEMGWASIEKAFRQWYVAQFPKHRKQIHVDKAWENYKKELEKCR